MNSDTLSPLKKMQGVKRILGIMLAIALALAGMIFVNSSASADERESKECTVDEHFNPFGFPSVGADNNNFTVVGTGDVKLGNGELEGSVAAFGSIEALGKNYPIRHYAAGTSEYFTPVVDGVPVRILANQFIGTTGSFDVSNENAPVDWPFAQGAGAKLIDV